MVVIDQRNVVGSYAVYHETNRNNNYKTGKVFHIYRPQVKDSKGNTIWGELSIVGNVLSVTVDQTWLDKANYPVVIDPTIGYTSIGGSNRATATDAFIGPRRTASENGTITSITWYNGSGPSDDGPQKLAVYEMTGTSGAFIAGTDEVSSQSSNSWHELSVTSGGAALTDTKDYFIVHWGSEAQMKYDSGSERGTFDAFAYVASFPDPNTFSADGADRDYSIYATYTAGGGGGGSFIPQITIN